MSVQVYLYVCVCEGVYEGAVIGARAVLKTFIDNVCYSTNVIPYIVCCGCECRCVYTCVHECVCGYR